MTTDIFDPASPFTFSIALTPRYISYLLVTCFEGGSNDWVTAAVSKNWTRPEGHTTPWYDDVAFVGSDDFAFEITYDDPEDEEGNGAGNKTITRADIITGLAIMAQKAPHGFGEIISDNHDALSADSFLQCVVMGDVIYG